MLACIKATGFMRGQNGTRLKLCLVKKVAFGKLGLYHIGVAYNQNLRYGLGVGIQQE